MNSQTAAEDGKRILERLAMIPAGQWDPSMSELGKVIGEYIGHSIKSNEALLEANERLTQSLAEARGQVEKVQAKIDALMLEYCPNEMTPEQLKTWGDNQAARAE